MICGMVTETMPTAQASIKDKRKDRIYYGNIISGTAAQFYKCSFDALPHGHNVVERVKSNKLKIVQDGEEEVEFKLSKTAEECAEIKDKKKPKPADESVKEFLEMDDEQIAEATTFNYKYGEEEKEFIKWTILKDTEDITEDPLNIPKEVNYTTEIPWDPDVNKNDYNSIFFDHFFPSIKGHAKIIDDWLHDKKSPYYKTATEQNIQFP